MPIKNKIKKEFKKEMKKEMDEECCECSCHRRHNSGGVGGAIYGLGFLGAAIYYVSTATGFWMGVLGILKALLWPAFLVFEALKFLA